MAKKRGRPTILTPDIERLIASHVSANRKKSPEQRTPRKILAYEIQQEIARRWKEQVPELSTLEKRISHYGSIPEEPFDRLFSLASLLEHPIPPEAMPTVMAIYKKALPIVKRGKQTYMIVPREGELTIREAQWIARLYKLIDDPDLLWDWAWFYAQQEWLAEVTGKPFDFPEFDLELMENPQWARNERTEFEREIAIWDIAEKYNADPIKLKELNLSIKQTEKIARSGKYKKEA